MAISTYKIFLMQKNTSASAAVLSAPLDRRVATTVSALTVVSP